MLCIDSGLNALAAAVLPVPLNFSYIIINAFKKKLRQTLLPVIGKKPRLFHEKLSTGFLFLKKKKKDNVEGITYKNL